MKVSKQAKQVARHLLSRKTVAKQAQEGKDMGKENDKDTGFQAVAEKAGKRYGSKKAGKKVAAAVMWKMFAKKK